MEELSQLLNQPINEKYAIPVKEYWSLPEKNKQDITSMVIDNMFMTIKDNPKLIHQYIFMLDVQMENALEVELFEHADIVQRIKNKLIETYTTI
jgi:hypothetical protein